MTEQDPDALAEQRDREAEAMQKRSEELAQRTSEVREDWERKRRDAGVPGAPEPEESGDSAPKPDETPP